MERKRGSEVQSAYSFTKHVAAQLNFFYAGDKNDDYGSGYGNYIEAAAGYFKPLAKSHFIFETYSGAGIGSVKNNYDASHSPATATTSVTKFFIQPSLGFSCRDIDMAFSSKFSLIDLNVRNTNVTLEDDISDYDDLKTIRTAKPFFRWEPGIMVRGGFQQLKVSAKFTYSLFGDQQWLSCNSNLSLSLVYLFRKK